MSTKPSKLYSIFTSKCPQCRKGEFFKEKLSFNILKATQTRSHCPNCNLKYMREPSFFYGAMYVGYGLNVAVAIAIYIVSTLIFSLTMKESIITISIGSFLFAPWSLRLSRIIWISIFVKYQPDPTKRVL